MKLFRYLMAATLIPSFSFAAALNCTAKRLDQAASEYDEQALDVVSDQNGIFMANKAISDCYFSIQSHDPTVYQAAIEQKTDGGFVSTYSGLDPKGNLIVSYSKNKGSFVCMLVCSKPAQN